MWQTLCCYISQVTTTFRLQLLACSSFAETAFESDISPGATSLPLSSRIVSAVLTDSIWTYRRRLLGHLGYSSCDRARVADGVSYSWLSFCHHSFPPVGRNQEVCSRLFYAGSVFLERLAPFVAQEKSAGLLGWEWIYVLALLRSMNGSESLRVRKLCASTQL